MRLGLLVILVALLNSNSLARDYFVTPQGSDQSDGSRRSPLASIQRAQQLLQAGDTVWIAGGTYKIQPQQITEKTGVFARVVVLDKSGTRENPIRYYAYGDDKPVFDFSAVRPEGFRVTAFYVSGSWIHLKGIEVVGVQVTIKTHTQSICFENHGSDNVYEQLSMHDGMAIGVYCMSGSRNLFLNCDAYRNHDSVSEDGRGGNVDGFGCHPSKGSVENVFRGCRAWYNSDDGYDCISAAESVTFENCWAFYNGLSPDGKHLADGNGFKAGGYGGTPVAKLPNPIPRHVVRFCLAVGNKASGFYSNHHIGGSDWTCNSAYQNAANFNMRCRESDNKTEVPGYGHVLTANLSYHGRAELTEINRQRCTLKNNSFDRTEVITDQDFVSLDESQLTADRQKDGSLPVITFLHPVETSALRALGAFASPATGSK